MVLLQQRQKQRVIVVVSVVKGQDDRLFITLEVRKILKKDRLISILGQILQLLLQLRRPDEQVFLTPAVVADRVVHEDRHLPPDL